MNREELIEKAEKFYRNATNDGRELKPVTSLMADFTLSVQLPCVTDDEIRQEAIKSSKYEVYQMGIIHGAKWMRDLLTKSTAIR